MSHSTLQLKQCWLSLRRWLFPWATTWQKLRTSILSLLLLLLAGLFSFQLYGRACVYFYQPSTMFTLSGKTQTQCVGRYLIDVPVELGRLDVQSSQFIYGLTADFRQVTVAVKFDDFTRAQFEKAVQGRLNDIKGRSNEWGTSKLLAQETLNTPYGPATLLRYLDTGYVSSGIVSEIHILVGNRYALLTSNSYAPDPEPPASLKNPVYTFIDPKPAEDRLRKVALNIKGYSDASKAPEGFCLAGVVMNNKSMGYDVESAMFFSSPGLSLALPYLHINMQGQYAGHGSDGETLFERVDRVAPILQLVLASEGGQLVTLRRGIRKINAVPAREHGDAMHVNHKVIFHFMAETALPKEQQSLQRPFFNLDLEVGRILGEKTSPLNQEQTLQIWDTLLDTMRLAPVNGGSRIDQQTGLPLNPPVPSMPPPLTAKVGQPCPKSGVWEASLPPDHPDANRLALRFLTLQAGAPMPIMFRKSVFPQTADADNAAVTWTWVKSA